jgi:hypothetical protein
MLRMQHIKTVNSSTMLLIKRSILRHPDGTAYQYIATENSITITQKIKTPVLEREYVRFYV